MSDRIPTKHDMDIVDALDLMYQHYMDQTDTDDQAAADFERNEAITIKRAMNEISSLRARLERAREKISMSKDSFTKLMEATKSGDHGDQIIARHCEAMLRELETSGGGDGS